MLGSRLGESRVPHTVEMPWAVPAMLSARVKRSTDIEFLRSRGLEVEI